MCVLPVLGTIKDLGLALDPQKHLLISPLEAEGGEL